MGLQIPGSFELFGIPVNAEQWKSFHELLVRELRANPLALGGPRKGAPKNVPKGEMTWDDWFWKFADRDDVKRIFCKGATEATWMDKTGKWNLQRVLREHTTATAIAERKRKRKLDGVKAAKRALGTAKDVQVEQASVPDLVKPDGPVHDHDQGSSAGGSAIA
ncbi:hypothetical protein C7212DRAFT_364574 [Tuber magnatum]|uniref:Uncharacterized protein n=1 Tax=Tuber magnatum TaxID=42249 RepID=A0A317SM63_9PEZI|nr:hypothetical protein C7212DRAFT_364574 [Tuber magnatum]